jgi:hypothetical protein
MRSLPLCLFLLAACGSNQQLTQSNGARTEDSAALEMVFEHDLFSLDVCQRISEQDVAAALRGVVLRPAMGGSDGVQSVSCEYEIDPAGDDGSEVVAIRVAPVSQFPGAEAELEAARARRQRASTELIAGLGDESYIIHNETERQVYIQVRKGSLFISVRAEEIDGAKRLAQLAVPRL